MENVLKTNNPTLLLAFIVYQNLYGMDLPEEKLKLGIRCVSKMIDFISDDTLPELLDEEKAIIHEMFNNEFKDLPSFSQIQDRSPNGIFDLLVDESNSTLPGILRDKIITRCHNLYCRQQAGLFPSLGIIRVFIRSTESLLVAKLPISMGQGVVIGQTSILTAKHVLDVSDEYRYCTNLRQILKEDTLPNDYTEGKDWDVVRLFSLPDPADPTKDVTFQINDYSWIDKYPKIDIACAHSAAPLSCPIVKWTSELGQPLSVRYLEYDSEYRMYTVDGLRLDVTSYPNLRGRNQGVLLGKFMKPGMSGSGIVCTADNRICGIFNGIENYKQADDYVHAFRFTPLQKLEGWLIQVGK